MTIHDVLDQVVVCEWPGSMTESNQSGDQQHELLEIWRREGGVPVEGGTFWRRLRACDAVELLADVNETEQAAADLSLELCLTAVVDEGGLTVLVDSPKFIFLAVHNLWDVRAALPTPGQELTSYLFSRQRVVKTSSLPISTGLARERLTRVSEQA